LACFTKKSAPDDGVRGAHDGTVSEDALLGALLERQTQSLKTSDAATTSPSFTRNFDFGNC
jgi:hypothetical protein